MNTRLRSLYLATLLPLVLAQAASAQAPTPGERWKTTMSMEMAGMKMPGMTSEVCTPKNVAPEPEAPQENCTISNRQRVGNTDSFDMTCTGKNPMTARMEMTQESPTRWRGKMLTKSKDGEMTMNYSGEKLPGECDASEMERKMNQLKAQGDARLAKECAAAAKPESLNPTLFVGAGGTAGGCKDAESRKAYCESVRTPRGYTSVARYQRLSASPEYRGAAGNAYKTVLADTGKLCGFAPETVRTQLCSTAQGKKEWTFLAEDCPEISKPLAQRECAGRDFTTPVSPPFVAFCSAYAAAGRGASLPGSSSDGASGDDGATAGSTSASGAGSASAQGGPANDGGAATGEEAGNPADKAKEALNKGKQALKGLFGR
jgi:hypothetical protein